jgi:hypothetical protein
MNQINMLNKQGGTSRGIQDDMFKSQYDAATSLSQEPGNRLGILGGVLQRLLPSTGVETTFGNEAGVNSLAGLLKLLGAIE